LLEKKISQLGLKLEATELQPLIQQLYDELAARGQVFMPPCHVGDEWFVPVGIPSIFVPFFLVTDRLRKLERKMIQRTTASISLRPIRIPSSPQMRTSPCPRYRAGWRIRN